MKNLFEILTGKKKNPSSKEMAELFIDLEIQEPKYRLAVESAAKDLTRLGQSRLSGNNISDGEISTVKNKLEEATLNLKSLQESMKELEDKLFGKIEEERQEIKKQLESLYPEVLKEQNRIKKELAEKLLEVQILFNCLRGESCVYEILNMFSYLYDKDFPDGENGSSIYMNMLSKAQENSRKKIKESIIGRTKALERSDYLNISDRPEEVVERLLQQARDKARVGARPLEPSLN